jgi:flagellar biosynthesis protein FlhG
MSDQADALRQLVKARTGNSALAATGPGALAHGRARRRARSLVFTSGKGGVGTSNLVLNIAIELARLGQRVVVVDADLGLANLDLLCGVSPPIDLGDVLSGDAKLSDAILDGPEGIRLVPGAHGMRTLVEVLGDGPRRLVREMTSLDTSADFILIDAGSGLGPSISTLAEAADEVVVVTTPEPTAMADALAAIRRFCRHSPPLPLRLLVNQAASQSEAHAVMERVTTSTRQFLMATVTGLGHVRADSRVSTAVRERRPLVVAFPGSIAARGVRRLARSLLEESHPRTHRPGFFAFLANRWVTNRRGVRGTRSQR